jgi:hypothetical protein
MVNKIYNFNKGKVMPLIFLLVISSLLLVGCGGSKFFDVANEQMRNGYEWHYVGRKDATKENIEYIPSYKGSNGEEYIHFQLRKPF